MIYMSILRRAFILLPLLASQMAFAQPCECELPVVTTIKEYKQICTFRAGNTLMLVTDFLPDAVIDMPYARADNFTKTVLYPSASAFLSKDALFSLRDAQAALAKLGYGLKIWDAYRPFSVTCKMWGLVHDARYVADPAKGSDHNRGAAVDITLIDLKTGKELDMGTGFDDFTAKSHHGAGGISKEAVKNRNQLKQIMEKNGFSSFPTEWWHYVHKASKENNVFDIPFDQL